MTKYIIKYFIHGYNFFLFLVARASIVFFGRRNSIPRNNPHKILLVQLSKLGDMVCFTPVMYAIRQALPETKIYMLGDALNKELLQDNHDFDEYIVFEKEKLFSIIRRIRQEKIEVACIRGTGFLGLVTVLVAGIKTVIAARVIQGRGFETRTYKWLLPYVHIIDLKRGEYMPRQFLRLLEPLHIISDNTEKHLDFSKSALHTVEQLYAHHGVDTSRDLVVGLTPSAGNKIKEWPEERFAKVIDHLIQKYKARIILIGGSSDSSQVQEVIRHVTDASAIINLQGQCNLDVLKALISKLDLFISVDTGPIYIAEAFHVPTIDIVGPMDEQEQPPRGPLHRNVLPTNRRKPELSVLNSREYDKVEARRQTESITADMVIEVFEELYPHIKK